jgi:hypothetical protein
MLVEMNEKRKTSHWNQSKLSNPKLISFVSQFCHWENFIIPKRSLNDLLQRKMRRMHGIKAILTAEVAGLLFFVEEIGRGLARLPD